MAADCGTAVVHGNTAYFSRDYRVYSYTPAKDEWTKLPPCEYYYFGLGVVKDKITTVGGSLRGVATNSLHCLEEQGTKWREILPPMPTARVRSAVVTTPTHLIVAGGRTGYGVALSAIEILNTNTLQWSSASSSPEALGHPHMSLCGEHLYLSEHNTIFSCSEEELLKSCKPTSTNCNSSDGDSVWTELSNIPIRYGARLISLKGQVLAIGGRDQRLGGQPSGALHNYNRNTCKLVECYCRDTHTML